ncbi:MAG: hypothetical protein L0I62_09050 [Gammaproteobacteria bacterium]|nr:hypothetical protein [Gammaproteobacteria bacterium]
MEIDRIGDTCYAVPTVQTARRHTGTNKSVLPNWMFAHTVPCFPGRQLSIGDDFLRRLGKRIKLDASPSE